MRARERGRILRIAERPLERAVDPDAREVFVHGASALNALHLRARDESGDPGAFRIETEPHHVNPRSAPEGGEFNAGNERNSEALRRSLCSLRSRHGVVVGEAHELHAVLSAELRQCFRRELSVRSVGMHMEIY